MVSFARTNCLVLNTNLEKQMQIQTCGSSLTPKLLSHLLRLKSRERKSIKIFRCRKRSDSRCKNASILTASAGTNTTPDNSKTLWYELISRAHEIKHKICEIMWSKRNEGKSIRKYILRCNFVILGCLTIWDASRISR